MFLHAFLSIENQGVLWPGKQKDGLLALFVAKVGLLIGLLTLGD